MSNWIKYLVAFQSLILLLVVGAFWIQASKAGDGASKEAPFTFLIVAATMGAVTWLISAIKMTTELTREGIRLKYFPFKNNWKEFSFNDVASMEVMKGDLLKDFGGWGYGKGFGKSRSYTTKGNYGLKLQLHNGKQIFIGTQQPKVLERALQEIQRDG
ncbi:MAG: hypothetical protein KTR13_07780 [Saprospiraceae bacterium]|nr:hypothetical protein [Saprospiraceae bacterium]